MRVDSDGRPRCWERWMEDRCRRQVKGSVKNQSEESMSAILSRCVSETVSCAHLF